VSPTSFLVGVGLDVVARNEFLGRTRLRSFDPSGLELLWRNQLGFMALIIVYCAWSLYGAIVRPASEIAELVELLGDGAGDLVRSLTLILYGAVIVATAIFQGMNARYYHVRVGRVREYLRETPQWVVDRQRSAQVE
jgi:hypothetical protein